MNDSLEGGDTKSQETIRILLFQSRSNENFKVGINLPEVAKTFKHCLFSKYLIFFFIPLCMYDTFQLMI